jgi:hypothetical protein
MKFTLLVLALASVFASAQDPGMMAAQQASQQAVMDAQQANQQAMQNMQQASQTAAQNAQMASQNNGWPVYEWTSPPKFSINPGTVAAGTTVRLKSRTHYAVIYYTTNGWTPTEASRKYEGPIKIDSTMHLQAIAVSPHAHESLIASAHYVVPGTPAAAEPAALSTDGVLHAGTRLKLVTDSTINSKTAQVGDAMKLELAQDVKVGDTVIVPKGTPVEAIITKADRAGHIGTPGDVEFEVRSLTVNGVQISLKGGETLEGANHYTRAKGFIFIPVVGVAGLAARGDEAEIKPGMTLSAAVTTDTTLQP